MANEFVSFEKLKLFLENIKTKIISPLSIRISSLEKSHGGGGGGTSSSFEPRSDENQNRPDIAKDKYWKCVGFGDGINTFPNIHEDYSNVPNGSALPNCTGYAQGRLFEIIDQTDAEEYVVFTRGNAEQIYDQYSENQRGQIPKLGAVMCWKNRGDGYGHVAIVEVMNKVGDHYQIIASESMYPRDESQIKDRWYMVRTYEYSNGGYYNSMVPSSVYEFQGFVYAVTIPETPIQDLARVAYTGKYSDLLNTPIIPDEQINSDWNATSGKAQILNKPASLSDFEDDVVSGNYLPLTGGKVDGVVQLGGASPAIEFINVYGEINGYVNTGTPFHNMKDPLEPTDGANKKYVDAQKIHYTTEEQDTGLTFIDGKKIYQITVNYTGVPAAGAVEIATGLPTMSTVVEYSAIMRSSGSPWRWYNGHYFGNNTATTWNNCKSSIFIDSTNGKIYKVGSERWGNLRVIVTIRYTKP